jgi:hypothetical protein
MLDKVTLSVQIYLSKFSINGRETNMEFRQGMILKGILMKVGKTFKDSLIRREKK